MVVAITLIKVQECFSLFQMSLLQINQELNLIWIICVLAQLLQEQKFCGVAGEGPQFLNEVTT